MSRTKPSGPRSSGEAMGLALLSSSPGNVLIGSAPLLDHCSHTTLWPTSRRWGESNRSAGIEDLADDSSSYSAT